MPLRKSARTLFVLLILAASVLGSPVAHAQDRTYTHQEAVAKSREDGGKIILFYGPVVDLADNLANGLNANDLRAEALRGYREPGLFRVIINGNEINKSFTDDDFKFVGTLVVRGYDKWVKSQN
jgi:hypothetical protein|tara:strand:+ start:1270 stop:1641 length:372 start_codon:yes stop_codon:yes gene_type:complete